VDSYVPALKLARSYIEIFEAKLKQSFKKAINFVLQEQIKLSQIWEK
jgi:DNA-binding XRE family transcriptional regulator